MPKPKTLLISLAITVVLGALAFTLATPTEPSYHGHSLSYWVRDPDSTQSQAAVQAMGTNVIPVLLSWTAQEPAAWKKKLRALPFIRNDRDAVDFLYGPARDKAANGFLLLGTNAAPAIPALVSLMKDTNRPNPALAAIDALANMGEPGLQSLGAALADTNQQERLYIMWALPTWADAARLRPILCAVTNDPDWRVRGLATQLVVGNDEALTNPPPR